MIRTITKGFIPEAIKVLPNWCAWRLEKRKDRMTKVPYQTNGKRASQTDRNTWTSFDAVTELISRDNQYNGYGFMLSDNIVFVDVDHCISDDGTMDSRGADILSAFPLSFCEVSQSGHGLHILTRGTIPYSFNNRKFGVELYAEPKYCAMTGNALQTVEPTEEQNGIDYIVCRYGTHPKIISNRAVMTGTSNHSDNWVIKHASSITGEIGKDFRTLFSGDSGAYQSQSEADIALCTLLAFWCDRDPVQIDRIFRQSGLYRYKWERQDYRDHTINHACRHIPESLSEWKKRMLDESCRSASAMEILAFGKRDDEYE